MGSRCVVPTPLREVAGQVAEGVLQLRGEVVVGPEDEDAGDAEEPVVRVEQRGHGIGGRDVVARRDDEVGVERGEAVHPGALRALARQQVQVGQVQHPQWLGAVGQHRHVEATQHEGVALDERGPAEHPGAGDPQAQDGLGHGTHGAHPRTRGPRPLTNRSGPAWPT